MTKIVYRNILQNNKYIKEMKLISSIERAFGNFGAPKNLCFYFREMRNIEYNTKSYKISGKKTDDIFSHAFLGEFLRESILSRLS